MRCHIYSSEPMRPVDRKHLSNFGRGHYEEHSFEIVLNLNQWSRRKYRLKKMFTVDARRMTTDHSSSP